MERLGHGSYNPVSEEEFLTAVTSSYLCVVHFAMDEQIYEGERAGLTVFYGKVKRKSSAVFDSV